MPSVQKQLLLSFSAEQMFDLVDDIESYASFLPWCGGTSVERISAGEVHASITIAFRGLKQEFSTCNLQKRPTEISLELKEGPFASLRGLWQFKALAKDACKVNFELHYEFSSRLLGLAIGPVFDQIAKGFVDAFVLEAEKRYET
jgi:ribosome-associated toxin RatA of RatAB toxin-antitoxin module